ncbi:hypothetical protein SDC9_78461 [bioreactor metagenome]|uniref:DUF11 domain-containing protein n=3 Tax=root TaxID=1 RepID=A0A644Z132_9ZZZZ
MANIEAIKSVDKSFIVLTADNDTLSYTIKITNTGTTDAQNVMLKDILPDGVSVINGSVYLNGEIICNTNFKCGIDLGNLPAGEEWTVTFSVRISLNISIDKIDNVATITYTDENGTNTVTTNTANTNIIIINLCVNKYADRCFALVGENINYTVKIENNGNTPINNVVLRDIHSDGIELVDEAQTLQDWIIGTINPNQTVVINFEMQVTKLPCPAVIKNKVCINFTYDVPETTITSPGVTESKVVTVEIGPRSTKEINISGDFTLLDCQPPIDQITEKNVEVEIVSVEKIRTMKNTSYQGQILTGCKLIVKGNVTLNIEYIGKECNQKVYLANFTVPFMTYIVIPDCCQCVSIDDITATIQDIYIDKIDCYNLYHNILVELEYTNCNCI